MDVTELASLLEGDLDTHLLTLKFLGLYGPHCQIEFEQQATDWASLVVMPSRLFAWDRINYPEAELIAFLDGTDALLIEAVWSRRPRVPVVLKSSDPRCQTFLERSQGLVPRRSFVWYTATGPISTRGSATVQLVPEGEARAMILANGYTGAELDDFSSRGGFCVSAGPLDRVASVCLVYPNHGPVWEIAAVKTAEEFRRQGWAQKAVSAAAARLQGDGRRIRYHVEATNLASRALAASIGLVPLVTSHHYPLPAR